jgi:hypothetical protein
MTQNEEMIERNVERMVDRLDASYMNGEFSDSQYREEMKKIDDWAESQYSLLAQSV